MVEYIIIIAVVLLMGYYIIVLKKTVATQSKVIKEQNENINSERIAHKRTKTELANIGNQYNQVVQRLNQMDNKGIVGVQVGKITTKVNNYDMDEILIEINKKGIKNIDKAKLDFLKGYNKK